MFIYYPYIDLISLYDIVLPVLCSVKMCLINEPSPRELNTSAAVLLASSIPEFTGICNISTASERCIRLLTWRSTARSCGLIDGGQEVQVFVETSLPQKIPCISFPHQQISKEWSHSVLQF